MADQKLDQLTAITTPASDDLFYLEHDPSGTPADRKITLANLQAAIGGGTRNRVTSRPTDGTTVASGSLASFGTAWTASITLAATATVSYKLHFSVWASTQITAWIGIYRDGTLIDQVQTIAPVGGRPWHGSIEGDDASVASGSHTYEVKGRSNGGETLTLSDAVGTGSTAFGSAVGRSFLALEEV